jgi:hypothetical protein
MKKLLVFFISLMVLSSCSTTRETKSSRAETRKEKKITDQALVKNAVQSRRFIIKFDRIYFSYGGMVDLIPRANFMIVDGEKAILNTAYLGRQYDIKPIAAIDIRGRAVDYALTDNLSKGSYEVKMKVNNGGANSFQVYIRISKNGYCSISVSSLKIDNVTYAGYLVPIPATTITAPPESNPI